MKLPVSIAVLVSSFNYAMEHSLPGSQKADFSFSVEELLREGLSSLRSQTPVSSQEEAHRSLPSSQEGEAAEGEYKGNKEGLPFGWYQPKVHEPAILENKHGATSFSRKRSSFDKQSNSGKKLPRQHSAPELPDLKKLKKHGHLEDEYESSGSSPEDNEGLSYTPLEKAMKDDLYKKMGALKGIVDRERESARVQSAQEKFEHLKSEIAGPRKFIYSQEVNSYLPNEQLLREFWGKNVIRKRIKQLLADKQELGNKEVRNELEFRYHQLVQQYRKSNYKYNIKIKAFYETYKMALKCGKLDNYERGIWYMKEAYNQLQLALFALLSRNVERHTYMEIMLDSAMEGVKKDYDFNDLVELDANDFH